MLNNKKITKLMGVMGCFFMINLFSFAEELNSSSILSQGAVLMDAKTGQVLFEKNMNEKEAPASTTKIMTGLLALEKGNLDDIITMSKDAVFSTERNSSNIALDVNEQISLRNALYGMAIHSANDAANGIAEYIGGTNENFINMMNAKAKELGALNTHFLNSNGLYDENHYSTAYDMALILRQGIKTPGFLEFFNKRTYTIPPTNLKDKERVLYNANSLLMGRWGNVGLIASKTGYTVKAQHTLVTAAKRGNRTLIVVVLNSDRPRDKYADTVKLLNYGFEEFNEITVGNDILYKTLENQEGGDSIEKILAGNPVNQTVLLHKSLTSNDIDIKYDGSINNRYNFSLLLNTHSNLMYKELGKISVEEKKEKPSLGKFIVFSSDQADKFDKEFIIKIIIGFFGFIFLVFALRTVHKIVND